MRYSPGKAFSIVCSSSEELIVFLSFSAEFLPHLSSLHFSSRHQDIVEVICFCLFINSP